MEFQRPKTSITTPTVKAVVELYEWITGEDRNYITGAIKDDVDFSMGENGQPQLVRKEIGKAYYEQNMRGLERFIASVKFTDANGDEQHITQPKECAKIVAKMPEQDTEFVLAQIEELEKKTLATSQNEKKTNGNS
jgi:hypothetical protein